MWNIAELLNSYPAVLSSSVNLHVATIVGILQQAIILKEQPGAFSQTVALVLVVLLDELLHQLKQTFRVPRIPLDQMLRKKHEERHKTCYLSLVCSLTTYTHQPFY